MQEDLNQRTLMLIISAARFTGHEFRAALEAYEAYRKHQKSDHVHPGGRQTVKQIIQQNQGVTRIELDDPDIRSFHRIARKYGVDYAIEKDLSGESPRYLVFFKGRDADAISTVLEKYLAQKLNPESRSFLDRLRQPAGETVKEKKKELVR